MPKRLKGFIIGMNNVAFNEGERNEEKFAEIEKLIRFLLSRAIQPVIFGNRDWSSINSDTNTQRRLKDVLDGVWREIPWVISNVDGTPPKPRAEAVQYLLERFGWDAAETVLLGNTEMDMRTAVNGGVLFLNAIWYGKNSDYGFIFESPLDVARFVDTFCLREHLWHYKIELGSLRYYALSPFSTFIPAYEYLSSDARAAAKWGKGHPDFWTKYIWSTLYFSELYKEIHYIAAYPGHREGAGNLVVEEPMLAFSKCFRKTYLRDFIVRHTQAQKSSEARVKGIAIGHLNQLNSIRLEKYPLRSAGDLRYKQCPVTRDKTVLVIDDICTKGYSLEAARAYIEQTGASVISMSWLKTINSDYQQIRAFGKCDPFVANTFESEPPVISHPYRGYIADSIAPDEVTLKLRAYDNWKWPT